MNESPTVYLVDDDPGARTSLSWLIRQADLSVCEFASGREFLQAFQMHSSACLVLVDRMKQLTDSEREVCELLLSGKSLKEIAIARGVAVQTVWKQRAAILKKMGVANDVELATAISRWAR